MTIIANACYSAGNSPVLRATSDASGNEYATITATIDNSDLTGPPANTAITAKCLGGDIFAPADPILIPETHIKEGDTGGVEAGNTYNIVSMWIECQNGDRLAVYTTGSQHFSDSDNVVSKRLPKGADPITGWGPETLIAENPDHATDNAGMRFQGGGYGVDPDNGRVWLCIMHRETEPSWVIRRLDIIYSDDHGVTWSTPVDIYPQFTFPKYKDHSVATGAPHPIPFGKIIRTSAGLICPMYVPGKQVWLMRSLDGITWNESDFILVDDFDGTYVFNEPNIEDLGNDVIAIVVRDDAGDVGASYSMSLDGGLTWSGFPAPTPFHDLDGAAKPLGAASVQIALIGNRVYFFGTAREPVDRYHQYACTRDEFVADPASLWDFNRTPKISATYNVQPLGEHYLNAGYGSILPVEGHEYTALMLYYTPNSSGTNVTNISIRTMVRI